MGRNKSSKKGSSSPKKSSRRQEVKDVIVESEETSNQGDGSIREKSDNLCVAEATNAKGEDTVDREDQAGVNEDKTSELLGRFTQQMVELMDERERAQEERFVGIFDKFRQFIEEDQRNQSEIVNELEAKFEGKINKLSRIITEQQQEISMLKCPTSSQTETVSSVQTETMSPVRVSCCVTTCTTPTLSHTMGNSVLSSFCHGYDSWPPGSTPGVHVQLPIMSPQQSLLSGVQPASGSTPVKPPIIASQPSLLAGVHSPADEVPECKMAFSQHSQPRISLPKYDGTSRWKTLWIPFKQLASQFDWNREEKLRRLWGCLQGGALDYAVDLSEEVRTDLEAFTAAMTRRFEDPALPLTYRAELLNLAIGKKESFQEFSGRVRSTVSKAYPSADARTLETLCVDTFKRGLNEFNLAYEVGKANPLNLDQAVQLATSFEAQKQSLVNGRFPRPKLNAVSIDRITEDEADVATEDAKRVNRLSATVTMGQLGAFGDELRKKLKEDVEDRLKKLFEECGIRCKGGKEQGRRQPSGRRTGNCFSCGEEGHFARECPSLPSNSGQEAQGNE